MTAANSGVGVFQLNVYPYLANRFDIHMGPPQSRAATNSTSWGPLRLGQRLMGLAQELVAIPRGDVALVATSPAPALLTIPTVGMVYDLRWERTRGGLGRLYRHADLRHLVHHSSTLIAISERTRTDLVGKFPEAKSKARVIHLGPGVVPPGSFSPGDPQTVLLIGAAKHKRNELAAMALAQARPTWAKQFIGLSVSRETQSILETTFGREQCEWHSGVDATMVASLYARAGIYVGLSLEEGFGVPFIEALSSGCQVIAIRQPLTVDLIDEEAVLLDDGGVTEIAAQLGRLTPDRWPSEPRRRARADTYSWETTAAMVEASLLQAAAAPSGR